MSIIIAKWEMNNNNVSVPFYWKQHCRCSMCMYSNYVRMRRVLVRLILVATTTSPLNVAPRNA